MIALTWVLLQALPGDFEGTMWRGPDEIGHVSVTEEGATRTLRTALDQGVGGSEWVEVLTRGERPGRASQAHLTFTPSRVTGQPPTPAKQLRAVWEENAVRLVVDAVQKRILVDHAAWFLHHREHLVGLFDLVDGVPRVTDVRRSFDGLSAGSMERGRWTAWYEGVRVIESARGQTDLTLHSFRVEAPGMMAQVYLDRRGGWARLEALGDRLPGLILENDRWEGLEAVPSRLPAAEVSGEEEVTFTDERGHEGSGRLLLPPQSDGAPVPAVLFLWGAGAHDANGDGLGGAPPRGAPFLDLVRNLADRGVASLRLADTGDPDQGGGRPLSARRATAEAALKFLTEHESIDPRRLAVLGHSEGCLVAAQLAALPDLAATVWIAPPDQSLPAMLEVQWPRILRVQGAGEDSVEEALGSLRRFLAELPESANEGRPASTETGWWAYGGVRWWLEHQALQPLELAATVRAPVLLVHGTRDLNVTPAQSEAWQKALAEAGHTRVDLHLVRGVDHYLVLNPSGDPMRAAEADRCADPRALEAIRDWLQKALQVEAP